MGARLMAGCAVGDDRWRLGCDGGARVGCGGRGLLGFCVLVRGGWGVGALVDAEERVGGEGVHPRGG